MRAILIDPKLHRVVSIELAGKNDREQVADMGRLIGSDSLDHTKVSDMGDYLWVADGGLQQPTCWAFKIRQAGPFAGTGIIIGSDAAGETTPPFVPIEMIQNDVDWLDEIEPELHWEESEVIFPGGTRGKRIQGIVTYKRVK